MNSIRDLVIYIIIGLALILAAGIYYWASRNGKLSPKAAENEVMISLSTGSRTDYRVGESFSLEVFLTVGQDEAKEIKLKYLNYDSQILKVQNITIIDLDGFAVTAQSAHNGQIEIDENTNTSPFTGSGKIAIINFQALRSGTANFTFNLDPNGTEKSAIISQITGKNILQLFPTN